MMIKWCFYDLFCMIHDVFYDVNNEIWCVFYDVFIVIHDVFYDQFCMIHDVFFMMIKWCFYDLFCMIHDHIYDVFVWYMMFLWCVCMIHDVFYDKWCFYDVFFVIYDHIYDVMIPVQLIRCISDGSVSLARGSDRAKWLWISRVLRQWFSQLLESPPSATPIQVSILMFLMFSCDISYVCRVIHDQFL